MEAEFEKTIIDLGTGDGRFIYKNALANPTNMYIGIDPSEKQLQIYRRNINRSKLPNAKLLVGSLENPPKETKNIADVLNISLPWGSLLRAIVNPTKQDITNIKYFLKPKAKIEILFGYSFESEPTESERLELPVLNKKYIESELTKKYMENNLVVESFEIVSKEELKNIQTSWSKKLTYGSDRELYRLVLIYNGEDKTI